MGLITSCLLVLTVDYKPITSCVPMSITKLLMAISKCLLEECYYFAENVLDFDFDSTEVS